MSSRAGRPRSHQPALAYDYRRYLTLVQVLALDNSDDGIRALCKHWNVKPVEDRSVIPDSGVWPLDVAATVRALAKHAMAYHRVKSAD